MISANIPNSVRKAVYRRDGYRCALCDSPKYIQIHHAIPRSRGGGNTPHNLICLCADCHAACHGMDLRNTGADGTDLKMEMELDVVTPGRSARRSGASIRRPRFPIDFRMNYNKTRYFAGFAGANRIKI